MLVNLEQNNMVQTTKNFWQKKNRFFITIFDRIDSILEDVSVAKIIVQC